MFLIIFLLISSNLCLCQDNLGTEETDPQFLFQFLEALGLSSWPVPLPITAPLFQALPILIQILGNKDKLEDSLKLDVLLAPTQETFDYVVVGAGAGGSVVSRRLSEGGKYSVLLLEAGGSPSLINSIPALALGGFNVEAVDWMYKTVPQKYSSFALINNQSSMPRGKLLGGSTSINLMLYARGHQQDYNLWANLTKDSQWNWTNVLPYFKKLENYHGNFPLNPNHGNSGPFYASSYDYQPSLKYWLGAGEELGFEIGDYNSGNMNFFSPVDAQTKDGKRESAWRAYYEDLPKVTNFKFFKYSQVTKVNFDSNMKAVSVSYMRHGKPKKAIARLEIILCAGVINTPQILMLSGIGHAPHLKDIGIEVKVNLPAVGKNLKDQLFAIGGPFVKSPVFNPNRDLTPLTIAQWALTGTGPLAFPDLVGVAYNKTKGAEWEDIQMFQFPVNTFEGLPDIFEKILGAIPGVFQEWLKPFKGNDTILAVSVLTRPDSVGEILLNPENPSGPPLIDPNYLSSPRDVQRMIEGMKMINKIYNGTEAYNCPLVTNPFPLCTKQKFGSDDYYECYLRNVALSIYHPVGTCRMGFGPNDKNSVVDSQLKVLGTKNLRIVDASIFPQQISANPTVPVLMVAEKASAMILS